MFETSLLPGRKGKDARVVRWILAGSVSLQAGALIAFIVVPLIQPDTLPSSVRPPRLTRVEMKRPELKVIPLRPQIVRVSNMAAFEAPSTTAPMVAETRKGGMISHAAAATDAEPVLALGGGTMAGGFSAATGPGGMMGSADAPVVLVKPAAAASVGPVRVSSGVSKGMLIEPIRPVYPALAKQIRLSGTVVVTAVIDRTGRIVNAQAVDGPVMLREAAVAAVREARYRPYFLNGAPTEVMTTISITFSMAG